MGQQVAHGVHDVDRQISVVYADVDVHAEGEQAAGDELRVLDQGAIAGRLLQLSIPVTEGGGRRPLSF